MRLLHSFTPETDTALRRTSFSMTAWVAYLCYARLLRTSQQREWCSLCCVFVLREIASYVSAVADTSSQKREWEGFTVLSRFVPPRLRRRLRNNKCDCDRLLLPYVLHAVIDTDVVFVEEFNIA